MGDEAREGFASDAQADAAPQPPPAKKRKGREEELRRVAQIVMVLSAMVEMRAGKEPTAAEMALAAEAREILARLCEEIRPKDLFSSEAVRVMVEDLGLNRSRDPALAFRQPKMSIADRVQHTKKKMEESRDHTASAHAALSHSTSFGLSSESHGSQRLMASKSSPMVLTAGGFPNNSTVHNPTLASSMSSMKQTPTSETQSALVKTSFGKDSSSVATPSLEAVNQRLDARINGPTYFTIVRRIILDICNLINGYLQAFRRLYEEVDLGWVYALTKYKPILRIANWIYNIWAAYRLQLTGRPSLEKILESKKKLTDETCNDDKVCKM